MKSGTTNSIPTVFCQQAERLGPQVSTFLDLAPGYNKAPQQETPTTSSDITQYYSKCVHINKYKLKIHSYMFYIS